MSNLNSISLDNAAPCAFDDHICPEPSAADFLDEARLLLRVLSESLHDDFARSYQTQVIIARINAAMSLLRQQDESA